MVTGVEVTRVAELEEAWEDAAGEADNTDVPDGEETDVATIQSLSILAEIAQTPAANINDVAVKIGIIERELRLRNGDLMLALLLSSAEEDCLRLSGHTPDTSGPG
jgi:hypothetical protein